MSLSLRISKGLPNQPDLLHMYVNVNKRIQPQLRSSLMRPVNRTLQAANYFMHAVEMGKGRMGTSKFFITLFDPFLFLSLWPKPV